MRNIIMYDPSIATYNMGDYIIRESIDREMLGLFENDFIIRYPTHTPIQRLYQKVRPAPFFKKADLKFLCGTNIFGTNLFRVAPNFNINIFDIDNYKNSISLGCGIGIDRGCKKFNYYTRFIYKNILSSKYIHSVRDGETKKAFEEMGFTAVDTGCATLWNLTPELCNEIPKSKSENVVFTLTDYAQDECFDKRFIDLLADSYKHLYYWVQGSGDLDYIKAISSGYKIQLVYPSLDNYKRLLEGIHVDYVGTRLHAGIYAMQKKRRAIILAVDNRAKDMGKTHNLPIVDRHNINRISHMINNSYETNIKVDRKLINEWKSQFCCR